MPSLEKLAGRITVLTPITHIIACGLYLAGYSVGFGGNIGGLFSASDFFTITIQHLIMIYFSGLAMPLLVIWLRHRSNIAYASDLIAKANNNDDATHLIAMQRIMKNTISITSIILTTFVLLMFLCQIWTKSAVQYYITINSCLFVLIPIWWRMADKLNFYGVLVEITWCILVFVLGVFSLGLDNGDRDRRTDYKTIIDGHMRCGDNVVITPIGSKYLSVTPDNQRHLINDDCEIKFNFLPTPIIPTKSPFDLIRAKIS